jgi:hypothetical protein
VKLVGVGELHAAFLYVLAGHARNCKRRWNMFVVSVVFCPQLSISPLRAFPARFVAAGARRAYTVGAAQKHPRTRRSTLAATCSPAKHPQSDVHFSTLYSELHRLARRQLGGQFIPGRLGATTLLHEAYLNMAKGAGQSFPDRARFMAYAARVMRGIIIDHARARSSAKKGGRPGTARAWSSPRSHDQPIC